MNRTLAVNDVYEKFLVFQKFRGNENIYIKSEMAACRTNGVSIIISCSNLANLDWEVTYRWTWSTYLDENSNSKHKTDIDISFLV